MRLRNKPWANDKIAEHSKIVIPDPEKYRGKWAEDIFQNNDPIHLEIGTGRGSFVKGMAEQHPTINFVGIEKFTSVIVDALDLVLETEPKNVRLLNQDAKNLTEYFADGEISTLYLNFSDPWPKNRHEKRRLTYKDFLDLYKRVLAEDGEIHFKTDNQSLFEYSLESFSRYGLIVKNVSLDLHRSDFEGNVMTEYEEKFSKKGNRIYRCEAQYR